MTSWQKSYEKIKQEILGWQIDDFGYALEGFFLNLHKDSETKQVKIIATDLGMCLNEVLNLNDNSVLMESYSQLEERLTDFFCEDEKHTEIKFVAFDKDGQRQIGFEALGIKYLIPKEKIETKDRWGWKRYNSYALVFLSEDEEIFKKMIDFLAVDRKEMSNEWLSFFFEDQDHFENEKEFFERYFPWHQLEGELCR